MHRSKGSGWQKLLAFVVAAVYCGIVAYIVVTVVTQAQGELRLARAGRRGRASPALTRLLPLLRRRG